MKRTIFSLLAILNFSIAFSQTYPVTTIAGNGVAGNSDGTGPGALFGSMAGSAMDNDGNLYVCDFSNNRIRKITTAGVVTTLAGSNTAGAVDGVGAAARFNGPHDIAFDTDNDVFYVADRENHLIRKIAMDGTVSTVAGGIGIAGFANGIGINARFNDPSGIAVDIAGNLIVADRNNHTIRKIIVATGQVSTLSGNGVQGLAHGTASTTRFNNPTDVVIDKYGFVYVTDYGNNIIRKLDYTGFSWLQAGSGIVGTTDGTNLANADFNGPYSIEYLNNELFVVDRGSHRIRKIDPYREIVKTIAGSSSGFINANGASAAFNSPSGITVKDKTIYVSDWYNYALRKIEIDDSCPSATVLNANSGVVTMGTISGTIPRGQPCFSGAYPNLDANANWWSFTPSQNGLLNISSVTPENAATVDTRLSIFRGICGDLQCFASNDNISGSDLRSNLQELILTAGTTYYFVWDDKATDTGAVNFTYTFTPQTCFRPSLPYVYNVATENSIHVGWNAPVLGDTTPDSYTLELGAVGFTPGTGTALQTITSTTATNHLFTGLNPNTQYVLYVKSSCSPTDISSWIGISTLTQFTAANVTYSDNFDTYSNVVSNGWTRTPGPAADSIWYTLNSPSSAHSGSNSMRSNVEYNVQANAYVYSRKLNLIAGQNYKVNYYARITANYIDGKYKVLVTPAANFTNASNHIQLHDSGIFTNTTYVSKEHNFVVGSNGEYRMVFKNESSKNIYYELGGGLSIDTFTVSTVLSVQDFNKSGLSMFPNPVLDHVSIANNENIQINTYEVVDINGRKLINKKYDPNNNLIDLSNLTKGIYFIQLDTEKGILSKKIIKE